MTIKKLYIPLVCFGLAAILFSCEDADDFNNVIEQVTCTDGIQNGEETGIDCGGECGPCLNGLDFSGLYVQEDALGRPGINLVYSPNAALQNAYNHSATSDRSSLSPIQGMGQATFPSVFQTSLTDYYAFYQDPNLPEIIFDANVLGQDITVFTEFLAASDALQVAPEGPTSFHSGDLWFTGRRLSDDVMDDTLLLLFGGPDGTRFDGVNGPKLISDQVDSGDRNFGLPFPYLEAPLQQ
jgi:hypothetical protein